MATVMTWGNLSRFIQVMGWKCVVVYGSDHNTARSHAAVLRGALSNVSVGTGAVRVWKRKPMVDLVVVFDVPRDESLEVLKAQVKIYYPNAEWLEVRLTT
jgi:hypothetical protein